MRKTTRAPAAAEALFLAVLLCGIALPAAAQTEIVLEKATNGQDADAPPGPVLLVGDAVAWTYQVTNVSSRGLMAIEVTDDQGVAVSCPATTLGPGESMTCTGNGVAELGQYANVGTVQALRLDESPVSDTDPSHYFGLAEQALSIEKTTEGVDADTPPGPALPVGSTVDWEYEVTNVGSEPLSDVEVTDDQGVTVTCPGTTLAVGESMTCTASGTVTPGPYSNLGTARALLPDETPVAATDPSHYFGQLLLLDKETEGQDADLPPGPLLNAGDVVDWTYEVTNPGPETVTNVAVTDDQGVVVTCSTTTLAAGESVVCTGSGIVEFGQYANVGTATAELPLGGVVSASDPSHYVGLPLGLQKSTNGEDADEPPGPLVLEGSPVAWTYEVTNFGDETLTAVSVTDDQGVTVTCPGDTLAPGEAMTCTANGTAQLGQYANVGTATAEHPEIGTLTATDPSHYFGEEPVPDVSAEKTAELSIDVLGDGAVGPGDTLAYTVIVANAGTGDATGVVFTDTPDPNTDLLVGSVTTTQGSVTTGNTAGDSMVEVAVGTLAAGGGTATITFQVVVASPLPDGVTEIVNQGLVSGDGFPDVPTDDPAGPGAADPTVVPVVLPAHVIPSLGTWGALVLLTLLAGLGVLRLGGGR